jgi:hypothetical protein
MQQLHLKSAMAGGAAVGVFAVASYLVTSPNASIGTAIGMIVACVVVVGAITLLALYGNRGPH